MRKSSNVSASPYAEIEVSRLVPSPDNPRTHYDEAKLHELAATYAGHGILEPLVVRPWPSGRPLPTSAPEWLNGEPVPVYEIAAGHRRYRAALLAGLATVPCRAMDLSDVALLEVFGIENAQREDLTPLEEALAFRNLLERGGYDVAGIAAKLGKGEGYVRARLSVDRLWATARRAFEAGLITLSHALLIAPLTADDQIAAVTKAIGPQKDGELAVSASWPYNGVAISVSELRTYIRSGLTPDLAAAPFDKAEPTLVPEMGPCDGCAFRTINGLFAGPDDEDRCLKRKCYETKAERHFVRAKAAAVETNLPIVSFEYSDAPEGTIPYSKWDRATTPSKDTTMAYVVDGRDKGQTVLVKIRPGAVPVPATANAIDKSRVERLERKEQLRLQRSEMLARRRALDSVLAAIDASGEDVLRGIARERVDILLAIATVKMGRVGSAQVYDSGLAKEMRHPGQRSGLAHLGLERHPVGDKGGDERAFARALKDILTGYALEGTYDEIFVPEREPTKKPGLCLFSLCGDFGIDVDALRVAAEWDTLSKGQKAERVAAEAKRKPADDAKRSLAQAKKSPETQKPAEEIAKDPEGRLSWTMRETGGESEIEKIFTFSLVEGVPPNVRILDDATLGRVVETNACHELATAMEGRPARELTVLHIDGDLYLCVGAEWRGHEGPTTAILYPAFPRSRWEGPTLDHSMGGVYRATRFFSVDGEEFVLGDRDDSLTVVGAVEAERIRVKASQAKEAVVV